MKRRSLVSLVAVLITVQVAIADDEAAFPRERVVMAWGWTVAQREDVVGIDLDAAERAGFVRGVSAALEGRAADCDPARASNDIDALAAARRAKLTAQRKAQHEAEAARFFSTLKNNSRVVCLPSGLCYEVLRAGKGDRAKPQQTVVVSFTGTRVDGTEFIQNERQELILVPGRVIRGLYEGLQELAVGARARLYVPPSLSVGEEAKLGIPVGAAVVYEVEVFEVKATPPDDLANSLLPPAPELPRVPPSGFSEKQLFATWGWITAQKSGAVRLALSAVDEAAFVKGIDAGIRDEPLPGDGPALRAAANRLVATERENYRQRIRHERTEAMHAYFADLAHQKNIKILPDGLRFEVLELGEGAAPRPGDIVIVDYVGRLLDGTVFDQTDNEPLHIKVGSVIEGFNEGIQQVRKGGRIRLYVPPELGYGDEDSSGVLRKIPGMSVLIYEIHLLDVQPDAEAQTIGQPPTRAQNGAANQR